MRQIIIIFALILPIFCINVLVIGKTGTGKSSLINYLIGNDVAKVGDYDTTTTAIDKYNTNLQGYDITFVDTPGFMDFTKSVHNQKIIDQLLIINNFNVILYCYDISRARNTNEDLELVELLEYYFTKSILIHVKLIFTCGNQLKSSDHIQNTFNTLNKKFYNLLDNYIVAYNMVNTNNYKNDIIKNIINTRFNIASLKSFNKIAIDAINLQKQKEEQVKQEYKNRMEQEKKILEETKRINERNRRLEQEKIENKRKYLQELEIKNQQEQTFMQVAGIGGGLFLLLLLSDEQLKDNITIIECYEKVCLYNWSWNYMATELYDLHGNDTGFIAQEIDMFYPECVDKTLMHLRINYSCVINFLYEVK